METVSNLSIALMIFALLFGIAFPTGIAIYLRNRFKLSLKAFFTGCAVWVIFVMILERAFHTFLLTSSVGTTIVSNMWYYALYGGLAAGLFEETGRLIAFKTVLRKEQSDDRHALLYGAGHGGVEVLILLGLGMVNNIIYSICLNTGHIALLTAPLSPEQQATFQAVLDKLVATSPLTFLAGPIERISAMILHVALSVLVWMAVTRKKAWLFPLAVFFHFFVDAATVVISKSGVSTWWIELIVFAMVVPIAYLAWNLWKKSASRNS